MLVESRFTTRPSFVCLCVAVLVGLTFDTNESAAQETITAEELVQHDTAKTHPWLRGTNDQLEMRIQGVVLDSDGGPAKSPLMSAIIRNNHVSQPIDVHVDSNRFEIWLPMHQVNWHSIRLSVTSHDGQQRASSLLWRPALRQIAINGLTLELQESTRTSTVNLVHKGKPVPNANLKIQLSGGAVLQKISNDQGAISIDLLPNETLEKLTAWTDKPLFGGYQFSRGPVRDPDAESHTLRLASCRDQTIRVIDGDGKPCPNVVMHLQVATPAPNINYLGTIAASQLTTNESGEAIFRWFPDWEDVHCYVDLEGDDWVIDGKSKWIDSDFVVQVKPRKPRQMAFGKLARKEGSKAGFAVFWRSFEGERERQSDHLTSVTDRDGNFSASVLPGATYCVFINDTIHVSTMVDAIPAPTDDSPQPTVTIRLQKPEVLNVVATAGANKRPVTNQAIYVRQTHDFRWIENDKQKSGSSARDRYIYTNDDGVATTMVESGKDVRVSIYNPDWQTEEKAPVIDGDPVTINLHREIDEPRTILGIIIQDKQNPIAISELTLTAGSVDGETRGSEQLAIRDNGVFALKTQATAVGMIAIAKDRSVAGVIVADNPRRLLRLKLQPTRPLRGQLVDAQGKPIAGRTVNATVRLTHQPKDMKLNTFYGYDANRNQAQTNTDGHYTFDHMPCDVEIAMSAEATTKRQNHWLGTVRLSANEDRPIKTDTIND